MTSSTINEFIAGRKFAFDGVEQDVIIAIKPKQLRDWIKISYCNQSKKECTGLATQCQIEVEKAFYDNRGWKRLWPESSDVDFSFMGVSNGGSDSLVVRISFEKEVQLSLHGVKVKVKLRFSAPSAGIAEIEQT